QLCRIAVRPERVEWIFGPDRPAGVIVIAHALLGALPELRPGRATVAALPVDNLAPAMIRLRSRRRRHADPPDVTLQVQAPHVVVVIGAADLRRLPRFAVPADDAEVPWVVGR